MSKAEHALRIISEFDLSARDAWGPIGDALRTAINATYIEVEGLTAFGGLGALGFSYVSGLRLGRPASTGTPETASTDHWAQRHARLAARQAEDTDHRVTVATCDDEGLFAWVTCERQSSDAPFSSTSFALLEELAPSLATWLRADQRLRRAPLAQAALDAALELADRPVVLATASGRPLLMSPLARVAWAQGSAFREAVRMATAGSHGPFRVTEVRGPDGYPNYLLVHNGAPEQATLRLHHAVRDWGLTARETEVLALVAKGQSNAAIATQLGCAGRTVELHVTRLLEKALVDNRATLIARFWTGERE